MTGIKRFLASILSKGRPRLPERWERIRIRDLDLSLDVPEDWVNDPSNLTLLSYDPRGTPADGRGQVSAGVMIQHTDWLVKASVTLTPRDALATMFRSPGILKKRERTVSSVTSIEVPGVSAADLVTFESTNSSPARRIRDLELFIDASPAGENACRLISVCCATTATSFESYEPIFETIIQSVRIG